MLVIPIIALSGSERVNKRHGKMCRILGRTVCHMQLVFSVGILHTNQIANIKGNNKEWLYAKVSLLGICKQ